MLRLKSEVLLRARRRRMAAQTDIERRRHIRDLFMVLSILLLLNVAAMMYFEDMSLENAAWLTMTTVTTVGYGDHVATSIQGRLATVFLVYIFGIFLLAQIAGEWIDYRFDRRDRMRRGIWRWTMKNHILILNTPDTHGDRYLRMLVEQIRGTPQLGDTPIQVFTPHFPDGLPPNIGSLGVVLRTGKPEGHQDISEADIEEARFIILLAEDTNDARSDSVNLDMLDQLSRYPIKGHVIVECVLESNRERFRKLGANAVIRPIRAYPELLVRSMAAPGTEAILEDLFVYAGNHPRRYDLSFSDKNWGKLASQLLQEGLGTPLGYMKNGGEIITNPTAQESVTGCALFIMVGETAPVEPGRVKDCIDSA